MGHQRIPVFLVEVDHGVVLPDRRQEGDAALAVRDRVGDLDLAVLGEGRLVERVPRRVLVVDQAVVAGSAYAAAGRAARADDPAGEPWAFAAAVAAKMTPPERVYVLDVCEADGRLWLLELNPFSGADLYACAGGDVVAAVSRAAAAAFSLS